MRWYDSKQLRGRHIRRQFGLGLSLSLGNSKGQMQSDDECKAPPIKCRVYDNTGNQLWRKQSMWTSPTQTQICELKLSKLN